MIDSFIHHRQQIYSATTATTATTTATAAAAAAAADVDAVARHR